MALLFAFALAPSAVAAEVPPEIVRGVTVSTHRAGQEWGSGSIGPTFDEIKQLGANWVAIHPYAGIGADGTVRVWDLGDGEAPPAYLTRPIREAHARGLKILIKPHLAYWGSPFAWRGEITFGDEAAWRRFWEGYTAWIVGLAEATQGADGFVVGTELDRTLGHEAEWRRLIARVRQVTDIPLTYAANWTDYERVGFWDALDVIGIQAYFPLTEAPRPSQEELRRAWQQRLDQLLPLARRLDRSILFTELGYNRSYAAAARPWDYATDGPDAEAVQQACLKAALEAIEAEPLVVGAFLWKWFPQPHSVGRNFQLATPAMRQVIRDAWGR